MIGAARSSTSRSVASDATTNEELRYQTDLEGWVKGAIDDGARDLSGLLESLPGTDPITAARALRDLAEEGDPRARDLLVSLKRDDCRSPVSSSRVLPIPHPLDYAWRFTDETATDLCNRLGEMTQAG